MDQATGTAASDLEANATADADEASALQTRSALEVAKEVTRVPPPEDPADATPVWSSFVVVAVYSVLTVTNFTIAIPTSARYTESFSVASTLAGLLVGLVPFFSSLTQPAVYYVLRHYGLRNVLLACCATNVAANVLYSLAPLTGSFAVVLVARCLMGSVGGPAYLSTYIARTTGARTRSKYMAFMSSFIGVGYGLGPLLGLLCEVVAHAVRWTAVDMDANTLPGWLMLVLWLVEAVLILVYFRPASPRAATTAAAAATAGKEKQPGPAPGPPLPWGRIAVYYLQIFLVPFNVAGWEILTVLIFTQHFRTSIETAAGALAGVNFLCVFLAVAHLGVRRFVSDDRVGTLWSFALAFVAGVFFFQFPGITDVGAALMFCVGGLLTVFGMQNAKGFLFSINSKWSKAPRQRQRVMMRNNMLYMMGRGIGAIVAPFVLAGEPQAYGAFALGLNLFALAVVGAGFQLITNAHAASARSKTP